MATCAAIPVYTGVNPNDTGLTVEEQIAACKTYRDWLIKTFVTSFNGNLPIICDAISASKNIIDTQKWKGIWNSSGVYYRGDTVAYDEKIFVSNLDSNTEVPGKDSSWYAIDVLSIEDFNDVYVEKTNLDPYGYNPNRVPQRDYQGDIRARLFRCGYTGESPDSNYIMTQSVIGNDFNWVYPRPSHVVARDIAYVVGEPFTGWQIATLQNGFSGYVHYRRYRDNLIEIYGEVTNESGSGGYSNLEICNIPEWYRPSDGKWLYFNQSTTQTSLKEPIGQIRANGDIVTQTIGNVKHLFHVIYKGDV